MKHFTKADILSLEKIYRANLINSSSGYKPANIISTISKSKQTNLAIFSSVFHLGANPPLLGMIVRPATVPRNSYENLKEIGYYAINHVQKDFVEKAHFTSAKFPKEVSEFDACKLTEEYIDGFPVPFVKESKIKLGMRFVQEIPLVVNNTILIIGEIEHLILPESILQEDGNLSLDKIQDVCVNGLETYFTVDRLTSFPFARPENLPDFK
ncbi:MAG: flavin reductase [Leptospiraceae bacterium]|nr:flavin reductase [Leptospiraceae bacterium]